MYTNNNSFEIKFRTYPQMENYIVVMLQIVLSETISIVTRILLMTRKDDNCLSCGSNSTACLDNNCGVSPDVCNLTITSFNNSCNFGVTNKLNHQKFNCNSNQVYSCKVIRFTCMDQKF